MVLTKRQKLEIESLMKQRRAEIAAELRQDAAKAREDQYAELGGAAPGDIGDKANADLLSDLGNAELSRDLMEFRALDAALARLSERNFGACLDCGAEIGLERLRAQPTAVRCFDCQQIHEKTFAHPGEPTL